MKIVRCKETHGFYMPVNGAMKFIIIQPNDEAVLYEELIFGNHKFIWNNMSAYISVNTLANKFEVMGELEELK